MWVAAQSLQDCCLNSETASRWSLLGSFDSDGSARSPGHNLSETADDQVIRLLVIKRFDYTVRKRYVATLNTRNGLAQPINATSAPDTISYSNAAVNGEPVHIVA